MAAEETKRNWSKGFNVNYALTFARTHQTPSFISFFPSITSKNICFDVFNSPYFCPPVPWLYRHQNVNINSKYLIMIYVWYIAQYVRALLYFHFHFWVFFFHLFLFCVHGCSILLVCRCFEEPSLYFGYWYFNFILHFNFK